MLVVRASFMVPEIADILFAPQMSPFYKFLDCGWSSDSDWN